MTSAIIETGGKQYKVAVGELVKIEKLNAEVGSSITFDRVLAVVTDGTVEMGTPTVATTVSAEVVEQGKGKKIRVFTYKSKKRQRRTLGHRQSVTTVRIAAIGEKAKKTEAKAEATPKPKAAAKKAAPKTTKATK
jgi:large subunit ribosomal protein L21